MHLHSAIVEAFSIRRPVQNFYGVNRSLLRAGMAAILEKEEREHIEKTRKYYEKVEEFWNSTKTAAEKWWEDMPVWEDDFTIDNGSATIYHDKNGIRMISNLVQAFDQNDIEGEISLYQNPVKEIYLTHWRGEPFTHPLRLKWHSSRDDFVIELIRSGLYTGTKEERQMYNSSGNWHGHHTVCNLFFDVEEKTGKKCVECRSIEHEEKIGIVLSDDLSDRIMRPLTSVGLTRPDGKKIYLHYRLSYYEFMMRLIETGHIGFANYPAHTIQARIEIDSKGMEVRRYYECYYYGPLREEESPLFIKEQLSKARQEQRKMKREDRQSRLVEEFEKKKQEERMQQLSLQISGNHSQTNAEGECKENLEAPSEKQQNRTHYFSNIFSFKREIVRDAS